MIYIDFISIGFFFILKMMVFFVRPINNNEKIGKSFSVVELPSNKEVVIHERPQDKHSKKFTFDKVFGPSSKQVETSGAFSSMRNLHSHYVTFVRSIYLNATEFSMEN